MKVIIKEEVYQKVMHWINKTDNEISGYGSLEYDKDTKTFTVVDAYVLSPHDPDASQRERGAKGNTSGSTYIDPVLEAKVVGRILKDKGPEAASMAVKWWWHSHVNMGCFWSGDDMAVMRSRASHGWVLSTVFNKKKEHRSAFLTYSDVLGSPQEFFLDSLVTTIETSIDPELIVKWDSEYDANCGEEKKWVYTHAPATRNKPVDDTRRNWERVMGIDPDYDKWREQIPLLEEQKEEVTEIDRELTVYHGGQDEWDQYGEKFCDQTWEWLHNPARDKSLTKKEKLELINELSPEHFMVMLDDIAFFNFIMKNQDNIKPRSELNGTPHSPE